jgi:hypothetical protein
MTPYPVKYIQRKKYYRAPQSQAITPDGQGNSYGSNDGSGDACDGCALRELRAETSCPEYRDKRLTDQPVICQDYKVVAERGSDIDESGDYDVLKDFIFIPATKKGIADYVAHLLKVAA